MPLTKYAKKFPEGTRIYSDPEGKNHECTFTHANHAQVPDYRNKWVMLNCFRWRLVWLEQRTTP